MLVFVEGGKLEYPAKNPRSKDENQQQTQPTWRWVWDMNLGPIGGRQVLSPCSHIIYCAWLMDPPPAPYRILNY